MHAMSDLKAHADLERFEKNLNPASCKTDRSFCVLGYGEISTVFRIGTDGYRAYKRMPLFETRKAAEDYVENYQIYCRHLKEAGIRLPPDELSIVSVSGRPITLYIIQRQYPKTWFAHHLIHSTAAPSTRMIFQKICEQIDAVWKFNQNHMPGLELALDGQLSNWLFENKAPDITSLIKKIQEIHNLV